MPTPHFDQWGNDTIRARVLAKRDRSRGIGLPEASDANVLPLQRLDEAAIISDEQLPIH